MNVGRTRDALPAQGTGLLSRHRYLSDSRTPPNQAEAGLAGALWDTAVTPAVTLALSPGCAAKVEIVCTPM